MASCTSPNLKTLPDVKRGDTWIYVFIFKNNTIPIDLTNCSARMQIRDRRTDELYAEASTDDSTIIIEPHDGRATVTFPIEQTQLVPPGLHFTDFELTYISTGRVETTQTIQIHVLKDETI